MPGFEDLLDGVHLPFHPDLVIPELHRVSLPQPEVSAVPDIAAAAEASVRATFAGTVTPGMSIAVGAGSRGLTGRVEMLAGVVAGLRALGASPFVVPAMGSHGGATADGQRQVLSDYGITEASIGAEIRSTMETVVVATTPNGMPLYLDLNAAGADRIFPVNRIKPHTCFVGPIESGLCKMSVVGFGKQPGAAQIHSCGPEAMRVSLRSKERVEFWADWPPSKAERVRSFAWRRCSVRTWVPIASLSSRTWPRRLWLPCRSPRSMY
jgi:hypothetical protein